MKKHGYVQRLIAFLMVVVMMLTLVVIENQTNRAAEEDAAGEDDTSVTYKNWEIDLTDAFQSVSVASLTAESQTVPTVSGGDSSIVIKAVPVNSTTSITGADIYVSAVTEGNSIDTKLTDMTKLSAAKDLKQNITADTEGYLYAVYMPCKTNDTADMDENGKQVYGLSGYLYLKMQNDTTDPELSGGTITTSNGTEENSEEQIGDYTYNKEKWYTKVTIAGLTAKEDSSPIDSDSITLNGTKLDLSDENGDDVYTYKFLSWSSENYNTKEGENTITYTVTNRAGRKASKEITFQLDTQAPAVTLENGDEETITGKYTVSNEDGEALTLKITDAISGFSKGTVTIKKNGTQISSDNLGSNGSYEFSLKEFGTYEIFVSAKDQAGNEKKAGTTPDYTIYVDNKGITSSYELNTNGKQTTYNEETKKAITYVGGENVSFVYSVTGYAITEDQVTADVTRTDADGNEKAIDRPTSTKTENEDGTTTLEFTYVLSDQGQGIYTFSFTTGYRYATDSDKKEDSYCYVYDKTAPTNTTVEFLEAVEKGSVYYYAASATPQIKITAEDEFALGSYAVTNAETKEEIKTGTIKVDDASEKELEKTIDLPTEVQNSECRITFYATDKALNEADGVGSAYVIDSQAPSVKITNEMSDSDSKKLASYWNNSQVKLTVTAEDNYYVGKITATATCDGKEIKAQSIDVDQASGTADFSFSASGVYVVTITASDEVGNETSQTCKFVIDKDAAKVSFSGIPADGLYTNDGSHPITVSVTDAYGIQAENITITEVYETYDGTKKEKTIAADADDLTETIKSSKTVISACETDGDKPMKYYFVVTTTDCSGNTSTTQSDTFYSDTQKPDISVSPNSSSGGKKYYNSRQTFEITVTEQFALGANVYLLDTSDYSADMTEKEYAKKAKETYTLANAVSDTFKTSASDAGSYDWTIVAVDAFGNIDTERVRFVIDKEKPVAEIEGVPEDKKTTGTTVVITITDNKLLELDDFKVIQCYKYYDSDTYLQKEVTMKQKSKKKLTGSVYCGQKKGKACSYYFKITGTDQAGNEVEYDIADSKFKVDNTLPEISLDHYPEDTNDGYYNSAVSFRFTVTEQFASGTTITIKDKNKEANGDEDETYILNDTTGTYTVKRTNAGTYDLTIKAVDAFGNEEIQRVKFVIDSERPTVALEGVPESGLTTGTKVTVTITDDEKLQLKDLSVTEYYKCYDETSYSKKKLALKKKDGKTVVASATCGERNGKACSYYFVVAGTDKAGNRVVYKTADSKFRVDATSPAVTITPRPEQTNDGYYNGEIAFDIEVTEQYAGAKIVVSDANKEANGDADNTFKMSGTEGTYSVKRSAEGTYNLKVSVEDIFGNVTEEETAFIIDTTSPTIGIATVNKLNNGNVTLDVDISDNYKGEEYTIHVIRKDSSGTTVYDQDYQKSAWDTSETEPELVFTEEGDYEITISADDKAGNQKIAENVTFRLDKTAPVLSITGVADSQTADCTATLSVEEAFSFSYENSVLASTDVTATITKKTDGAAATTVATLNTGNFSSGNPHTTTYTFDEDGEYTITFQARDLAGNTASEVTKTFKVDKTAPEIAVTAVDSKNAAVSEYQVVGGSTDSDKDYVDMSMEIKETFFASDDVTITVQKDGEDLSSDYFQNFSSNAAVSSGSQRFEEDGVYTVSVTAEDALGNAAEAYTMSFTVDNTAPAVENTARMAGFAERRTDDGDLLLNSEDFADILDQGYDALWTVNDTSVFQASVKLDGVDFVDFSDLSDGYHEMTITVTDELGHVTAETFDFTYDGTAPRIIISGVDDKSTADDPFTLSISLEDPEDVITEIVINGETIDPSLYEETNTYEYVVEERGTYEVKVSAKDTAGNVSSTYDSETGEVFSFRLGQKVSVVMILIIVLAVLLLLAVILLLLFKRRKKEQK